MKTFHIAALAGLTFLTQAAIADSVIYDMPYDGSVVFRAGDGSDVAEANCITCHSTDYIEYQPPGKGPDFWKAEVHKMIAIYGAPITEEDGDIIAAYLAAQY